MMRKTLTILFAVCALSARADFLGSIPTTNSMHGTTNYIPMVAGSHATQLEWLISPSNLVAVFHGLNNYRVVTNCQVSVKIANGGAAIIAGQYDVVRIPNTFTVTGWDIVGEPSGSVVVDFWHDTYANFPPTVDDTCAGSEKPTLSSAVKNQDASISTWNTRLTNGYYLKWSVDSATTVTNVNIFVYGVAQ